MDMQPDRSCKCGYSPLSPEDKFCPMCKEPVVRTKSRLASLQSISINRPRLILIVLLICLVLMLSSGFLLVGDWTKKGQEALDKGEYLEALKYFDRILLVYPKYSEAWYGKGDALIGIENSKIPKFKNNIEIKAKDYFQQADQRGSSYKYFLKMGDYYSIMEKDYYQAELHYRNAANLSSKRIPEDQTNAWVKLGDSLIKIEDKNKWIDALACFDKCIKISKDSTDCSKCREDEAESYYGRGIILRKLNNSTDEEIENNYIKCLKSTKDDILIPACEYLSSSSKRTNNTNAKNAIDEYCR